MELQTQRPVFWDMIRSLTFTSALALALSACGAPPQPEPAPAPEPAAEAPQPGPSTAPSPPAPPAGPFAVTPQPGEELPTSQTTPGPIPVAFRHVWAIVPADCTADPGLTRIAIAPGAVRFYEGRAVVTKSYVEGPDKLLLDVELMSEGETRAQRHALALNNAGSRLIYLRGQDSFTYIRCD